MDRANFEQFISYLPDCHMKAKCLKISPKVRTQGEKELRKMFSPTDQERRLKKRIQALYIKAQESDSKIEEEKLNKGICSDYHFNFNFCESPYKLMWAIQSGINYLAEVQDLIEIGLERTREILTMPIFYEKNNAEGYPYKVYDQAAVNNILKARKDLEDKAINIHLQEMESRKHILELAREETMVLPEADALPTPQKLIEEMTEDEVTKELERYERGKDSNDIDHQTAKLDIGKKDVIDIKDVEDNSKASGQSVDNKGVEK